MYPVCTGAFLLARTQALEYEDGDEDEDEDGIDL
jgi:hypothetical protein